MHLFESQREREVLHLLIHSPVTAMTSKIGPGQSQKPEVFSESPVWVCRGLSGLCRCISRELQQKWCSWNTKQLSRWYLNPLHHDASLQVWILKPQCKPLPRACLMSLLIQGMKESQGTRRTRGFLLPFPPGSPPPSPSLCIPGTRFPPQRPEKHKKTSAWIKQI